MAKEKNYVSEAVMRRMPKYYRYLTDMEKAGIERISSKELSKDGRLLHKSARTSTVRGLGQQGYGYNVSELRQNPKF